jgi:hypothetical protein
MIIILAVFILAFRAAHDYGLCLRYSDLDIIRMAFRHSSPSSTVVGACEMKVGALPSVKGPKVAEATAQPCSRPSPKRGCAPALYL